MEFNHFREAVVFLTIAGLIIPLVHRLRVSPVLAFLLAGLAVGPYGFARFVDTLPWLRHITIGDVDGVRAFAELGVVFLLFHVGLELSWARLRKLGRLVLGFGGVQILSTGAVIAAIAGIFGNPLPAAIVIGLALALSSTAIVVQLLAESGRLGSTAGRATFAVLLAQDLAIVPVLFITGALAPGGPDSILLTLGISTFQAAIAVGIILGFGRVLVQPFLTFIRGAGSADAFMAGMLLVITVTAALTHAAGLSAALGAFLVGLLLAETSYRYDIEVTIAPVKGLLLGLFFLSIGMGVDLGEIARNPFWIGLSVVGLMTIKAALAWCAARAFGVPPAAAVESALLLSQGGEFAFVIIGVAAGSALLPGETVQFMLIVVTATMMLTPPVASAARRITRDIGSDAGSAVAMPGTAGELSGHVIVVGFGRTGQLVTGMLSQQNLTVLAVEQDPAKLSVTVPEAARLVTGDASRRDMLAHLDVGDALAVVISTDDAEAAERVVTAVREVSATVPIVARARDDLHAERLRARGASGVIPEVTEAGLEMTAEILAEAGFSTEAAHEVVDRKRAELRAPG
ncbi:MAG: cation:proton antiporter [Pseudomonadota bacterium]